MKKLFYLVLSFSLCASSVYFSTSPSLAQGFSGEGERINRQNRERENTISREEQLRNKQMQVRDQREAQQEITQEERLNRQNRERDNAISREEQLRNKQMQAREQREAQQEITQEERLNRQNREKDNAALREEQLRSKQMQARQRNY